MGVGVVVSVGVGVGVGVVVSVGVSGSVDPVSGMSGASGASASASTPGNDPRPAAGISDAASRRAPNESVRRAALRGSYPMFGAPSRPGNILCCSSAEYSFDQTGPQLF
ncbi:hypothetical protein DV733_12065 [Halapricum salinum]|uniref:Uncharacterized protein n=1 Tax=Halapricum salinum TaxID=1457250 RepID=A0A4D6HGL4_9EURY|nr:hypothetical protein DV733_12065 [Halapricum salinum]